MACNKWGGWRVEAALTKKDLQTLAETTSGWILPDFLHCPLQASLCQISWAVVLDVLPHNRRVKQQRQDRYFGFLACQGPRLLIAQCLGHRLAPHGCRNVHRNGARQLWMAWKLPGHHGTTSCFRDWEGNLVHGRVRIVWHGLPQSVQFWLFFFF